MPVARIYASLVEEAEPICADLLARGYNVEIVFPDAVLPNPPDLELRVERCSAEQAIARVEAGGSPSRCVFVTPAKGPRRELLLVEMTVLGTGTNGRHPLMMPMTGTTAGAMPIPVIASIPSPTLGSISEIVRVPEVASAAKENGALADVLPFPTDTVVTNELLPGDLPAIVSVTTEAPAAESLPSPLPPVLPVERREDLGKHIIAELNSFLAHAPVVERQDVLPVRIFQTVRASRGMERARKNWEGWTLAGVAASLLLLVTLGWYAGPNSSRRSFTVAERPVQEPVAQDRPAKAQTARRLSLDEVSLKSFVSNSEAASRAQSQIPIRSRKADDGLVAADQVRYLGRASKGIAPARAPFLIAPTSGSVKSASTASEALQSAAIHSVPSVPVVGGRVEPKLTSSKAAPIKRITDLK